MRHTILGIESMKGGKTRAKREGGVFATFTTVDKGGDSWDRERRIHNKNARERETNEGGLYKVYGLGRRGEGVKLITPRHPRHHHRFRPFLRHPGRH
jgi:hypothetical protein